MIIQNNNHIKLEKYKVINLYKNTRFNKKNCLVYIKKGYI